jgi:hypothetical protein
MGYSNKENSYDFQTKLKPKNSYESEHTSLPRFSKTSNKISPSPYSKDKSSKKGSGNPINRVINYINTNNVSISDKKDDILMFAQSQEFQETQLSNKSKSHIIFLTK